jgi:hypothetical protein
MRDMNRRWLGALAIAAGIGGAILAFYLSIYQVRQYDQPIGGDTPHYLWRTNCVAAGGLEELRTCGGSVQAGLPNRVGNPILALLLSSFLPASTFTVAALLPPVATTALALAAAAFASWSLHLTRAYFAALALVLGTSPAAVSMIAPNGYVDTIVALALGVGALLLTAVAVREERGAFLAGTLLAAATIFHWATGLVLALVLLGLALFHVPRGWAVWRSGAAAGSLVAVRIGLVLSWAVLLWAVVAITAVRSRPEGFAYEAWALPQLFRSRLVGLGLPLSAPAVAIGWAWLAWGRSGDAARRRFLLATLSLWLGGIALAVAAFLLGVRLPVHRFLLLGLPVPLLGGLGLLGAASFAARRSRVVQTSVLLAGCVAVAVAGYVLLIRASPPTTTAARTESAATAGDYLDRVVLADVPVTVVADVVSVRRDFLAKNFLMPLPADRIADVRFRWQPIRRLDPLESGVVLAVRGYSRDFAGIAGRLPSRVVAPGVVALSGPIPAAPIRRVTGPRLESDLWHLLPRSFAALGLMVLVGGGWAAVAGGRSLRPLERVALAPVFGFTALLAGGLLADQLGLRLEGMGPAAVTFLAAAGGAVLAWRRRGEQPPDPSTSGGRPGLPPWPSGPRP